MNTGRLFTTLVAVIGFAISAGCSKPANDTAKDQAPPPVETDMEIVVPESGPDSKSGS